MFGAVALVEVASRDPEASKPGDLAIASVLGVDRDAGQRLEEMTLALQSRKPPATPPTIDEVRRRDWTPLWQIALEESLFLRRTTDPATGRVLAPASQASHFALGSFLVTLPTVIDDLVLVNEGFLIEGIDRYTGRLRWYRDHAGSRGILPSGSPTDLNEIVCADGECYTILGYGFGNQRGGDGALIRFDPVSGEERWRVRPDRLTDHPLLEGADACGPPMVLGDLLVVPLRKQTNRVETIDLVAAFDRSDGGLRWTSTIASSGSVRTAVPKPVSRLGKIDGDVLVSSAAGGIARLDGASGAVRWLRIDDVRLRILSISNLAWQLAGPVVCDRGIAVMGAARDRWMLLDPEDGSLLSSRPVGPGTRIGDASWLMVMPGALDGRDLLLAIGSSDLVAIDPADPDLPVWTLSETLRADGEILGEPTNIGIRGRVFAIEDGVVVPTVKGLWAVSARDGRATRILPMPGPSNPVVVADGIYAGGSRLLSSAMPIDEAIAALESRIRERPDAIPQALALLELSERLGRGELVRFAADAAVSASLRIPDGRRRLEVLERLLAVISQSGIEDGEHLLGLAERLARDPAGRVRLELVRGDWLTRHQRPLQAARAWLEVVDDPDVGSLEVPLDDDRFADAAVAASWRLDALYRAHPEIAERIAGEALEAVRRAIDERVEARTLIGLARRHPGSSAAIAATARAVEVYRDEGRPELAAAAALVAARGLDFDDPARSELLREAAAVAREFDRFEFDRILMRVSRAGERDGGAEASPSLTGIPSQIETLDGTPVPVSPSARGRAPVDGLLLRRPSEPGSESLVWLDAATLQPVWTLSRPGSEFQIVGWEPGVLLWEDGEGGDPRLTAVDRTNGEILWSTPRTTEVMPPAGRLLAEADGLMPNGERYESQRIVPIVTDHGAVFVRRDGSVSCIDLEDGRSVRWSRRGLMERVYEVEAIGGLLHLAGASKLDDGTRVGRVVSLDPMTGVTIARASLEAGEVRALVGDDLGRIAAVTSGGITMLDPMSAMLGFDGGWRNDDPRLGDSHRTWMSGDQIVF
ncbi:MAG: PQQ-binding-like beta-propeller repeat protein, partial [Planctomycetota bacterium]|nr:PQQ-binding-like beta-propeller repeat protein [Planctomycetota bacterium]